MKPMHVLGLVLVAMLAGAELLLAAFLGSWFVLEFGLTLVAFLGGVWFVGGFVLERVFG
jgi:hypothetical protein